MSKEPDWCQFLPPKFLERFDKNSADKIWSKKDKEIKISLLMSIRVKIAPMWAKLSFLQSFVLAINQSTSNQFAERKVNSDILQRVNWSNMIFDFFVYWLKLHQDFDRESAGRSSFFLAACFDLFRYGSFKSSHFHSQLFPIDIATYFSTGGIEEWQEYTQRISGLNAKLYLISPSGRIYRES